MHVNYLELHRSLDEICVKAAAWGFDGVEFRRRRSGCSESVEEYLDGIAAGVEKSGLKYVLFGSPGPDLIGGDCEREVDSMIAFYEEAQQRFALSVCNIDCGPMLDPLVPWDQWASHGSTLMTADVLGRIVSGMKRLAAYVESSGFKVAFETHAGHPHDLPQPTMDLVGQIESLAVGVNLDYGNIVYFPDPPSLSTTVEIVRSALIYVHLKNSLGVSGKRIPIGLEDGSINHREYLSTLRSIGYSGPICLEGPRLGDRERFAQRDFEYFNTLLRELKWT